MKIAVYTIAKNEETNVRSWVEATRDADLRIVLDTGSADRTVKRLRENGVSVFSDEIVPWRFDVARNKALALIPDDVDVCISLDMDETLTPGWRARLESFWHRMEPTEIKCKVVVDWLRDGVTPNTVITLTRVHARKGYYWHSAIHELLDSKFPRRIYHAEDFQILQRQDPTKNRTYYIELSALMASEHPGDKRLQLGFADELFFAKKYPEAIEQYQKFLKMPDPTPAERARAYVKMAFSIASLRGPDAQTLACLYKAVAEAPSEREPWLHLASAMASKKDWANCLSAATNAIRLPLPSSDFYQPSPWLTNEPARLLEISTRELGIHPQTMRQIMMGSVL